MIFKDLKKINKYDTLETKTIYDKSFFILYKKGNEVERLIVLGKSRVI